MPFQHPEGNEGGDHQPQSQPVRGGDGYRQPAEYCLQGNAQCGGGDQRHHDGAQAAKDALHHLHLPVAEVQPAQQTDDHQRGQHKTKRGYDGPRQSGSAHAHKGGGVDADRSGGHFCDGDQIVEDGHGNPAVLIHHLLPDQRDGHIAAAHTEQAHLQKAQKQFRQHASASFAPAASWRCSAAPLPE